MSKFNLIKDMIAIAPQEKTSLGLWLTTELVQKDIFSSLSTQFNQGHSIFHLSQLEYFARTVDLWQEDLHYDNILLANLKIDLRKMVQLLNSGLKSYERNYQGTIYGMVNVIKKYQKFTNSSDETFDETDIREFSGYLRNLAIIRDTILLYLALGCIIQEHFPNLDDKSIISIFKSENINISTIPNKIDALEYISFFKDTLFWENSFYSIF
jgi:hypothetical protein